MKYSLILLICLFTFLNPGSPCAQQQLVKILVTSPSIESDNFLPVADVMAGTIIRDLKRAGGLEILDREASEQISREAGGKGWVENRDQAADIGKKMNADIVIFSSLIRNQQLFNYTITFYQVKTNVVQRQLSGTLNITDSPYEIGRKMNTEAEKLRQFVPLPSELVDPGQNIRIVTVDPDNIPRTHEIEGVPETAQFGTIEQVLSYYRVFPGEEEYNLLAQGTRVMRFSLSRELDEELTSRYNLYNVYGDFANRQKLQAFFIENCSPQAIALLIANNIPVYCADEVLTGYMGLSPDGFCIFKTVTARYIESAELTYHDRMVVMFMVPTPGHRNGISKEYLETSLAMFKDEWDQRPKLVEITQGGLDVSSSTAE